MWHQQVRRRAVATYLPLCCALQPRPARAGGGSGSGGGPGRQAGRCGGGAVGRAAAQAERRSGAVGGPCRCGLVVSRNVGLPVTSAQRIKENCCCWRPCRCGPAACGCLVGGEAGRVGGAAPRAEPARAILLPSNAPCSGHSGRANQRHGPLHPPPDVAHHPEALRRWERHPADQPQAGRAGGAVGGEAARWQ